MLSCPSFVPKLFGLGSWTSIAGEINNDCGKDDDDGVQELINASDAAAVSGSWVRPLRSAETLQVSKMTCRHLWRWRGADFTNLEKSLLLNHLLKHDGQEAINL